MMMVVHEGGVHNGRDYSRGEEMGQGYFLLKLDFAPSFVLFYTNHFFGGTP